jgi:hypothetical protein
MHDDEEGFVHLKDIMSGSPAPSRQGTTYLERGSSEERDPIGSGPMVVEKAVKQEKQERKTRIQVRSDWTVSTESNVGRERQERSFLK